MGCEQLVLGEVKIFEFFLLFGSSWGLFINSILCRVQDLKGVSSDT